MPEEKDDGGQVYPSRNYEQRVEVVNGYNQSVWVPIDKTGGITRRNKLIDDLVVALISGISPQSIPEEVDKEQLFFDDFPTLAIQIADAVIKRTAK